MYVNMNSLTEWVEFPFSISVMNASYCIVIGKKMVWVAKHDIARCKTVNISTVTGFCFMLCSWQAFSLCSFELCRTKEYRNSNKPVNEPMNKTCIWHIVEICLLLLQNKSRENGKKVKWKIENERKFVRRIAVNIQQWEMLEEMHKHKLLKN